MSKIAIQGNASGTGTLTIAAPNTNTDRTLTLPDSTGTILTSATTTGFPAGSVLQVVQGQLTTAATTTSTSFVDTGLSASITPSSSSSKILVMYSAGTGASSTVGGAVNRILRGATEILLQGVSYSGAGSVYGTASATYLDSPATTSSVTYKIQQASQSALSTAYFNPDFAGVTGERATITLMEIAA